MSSFSDLQQGLTLVSLSSGDAEEWQLIDTCLILERLAVPLPAIAFNERRGSDIRGHDRSQRIVSLTDSVLQCMDEQLRADFGTPAGVSLSMVIPPSIQVCQVGSLVCLSIECRWIMWELVGDAATLGLPYYSN